MAPLWAITGRGDARSDVRVCLLMYLLYIMYLLCYRTCISTLAQAGAARGMSIADVLHDDASQCRVCVGGHVNGQHFEITRALKRCVGGRCIERYIIAQAWESGDVGAAVDRGWPGRDQGRNSADAGALLIDKEYMSLTATTGCY